MDKKIEKVINTFKPNQREKLLKQIAPKRGMTYGGLLGFALGITIFPNLIESDWGIALITIPCVLLGFVFEKFNSRKREYFSLIDNHRVLSIDQIASSLSVSYEKARKDINKMIEQGFFGNAHIDNITRSIVLPISGIDINTEVTTTNKICPSCGATNNVSSLGENKCEYCGTVLN